MVSLMFLRAGALAALVAALAGTGWYAKGVLEERQDLREQVMAQQETLKLATKHQQVTTKVLTKRIEGKTKIQERTNYVTVEIEKRIPAAGCVLSPDWRLLHDAAADPAVPLPPASGRADAAAVTAKEAAITVTGNYATCLDNADKLERLQEWIRDLSQKGPPQ